LDVHAHPQNLPLGAAAGMGFLQLHFVMQMQVHIGLLVKAASRAAYSNGMEQHAAVAADRMRLQYAGKQAVSAGGPAPSLFFHA
ncbi:hypothetical protein NBJODN_NBJODN_13955, partial [Dysosmobacter welbionis]